RLLSLSVVHDLVLQSRHWLVPPAGRRDFVRRLRRRRRHHRTGAAPHLAVLRRDVRRADAGDVFAGAVALAAAAARIVMLRYSAGAGLVAASASITGGAR